MINIVLDTNIIISSTLTPQGITAKIMNLIIDNEKTRIYYSSKIIAEYQKVLAYEKLKIAQEIQTGIVNKIQIIGTLIEPVVSTIYLPHEPDRVFYDAAKSINAILITGNMKHFPKDSSIMLPTDFLNQFSLSIDECFMPYRVIK